jgi:HEAT repeat protein
MVNIADPITRWAFVILVSVVMGTFLLVAVAFLRRWQQIRFSRYRHTLHRKYRPALAKVLSGARSPASIEALRELPLADLELLLDPLFSKRKLTERQLVFLLALCTELGLISLWQSRSANGRRAALPPSGDEASNGSSDRPVMRYLLRAKSIRNLGRLRHRASWPLLVKAVDDRHHDIQLLALRSLAAIGAPESFPVLRERLHAAVQGDCRYLPLQGLRSAMVSFDLDCAPALLPSLRHADRQIRLHAIEILRTMVCREAARRPGFTLTAALFTPPMVELLLAGLAGDVSAEIRARAAEILVFLADPRAIPVLCSLLRDRQWLVRLCTVRALSQVRRTAGFPHQDILSCLDDPHWRVREAAIQTLISLGQDGKHRVYAHFLNSPDNPTRKQIVEVIERSGLMTPLVEEYCKGAKGVEALMVEQLAGAAAPLGLSRVLRTLTLETRQKFLERFLPYAEARMRLLKETQPEAEINLPLQQALDLLPHLAA